MDGEKRVVVVVVVDNDRLEWKKRKDESSKVLMVARQDVLNKVWLLIRATSHMSQEP